MALSTRLIPLLLSGFLLSTLAIAENMVVRYNAPAAAEDQRSNYPLTLLEAALQRSGVAFSLEPTEEWLFQNRAMTEIARGQLLDVIWTMTSDDRESMLRPIRIPLFKGLIGWRLPLVVQTSEQDLADVDSLSDLQKLVAGQGHDWPDTGILLHNGLPVEGVASYSLLFRMLAQRRFDYFPRSILEIWDEAEYHADSGIIVSPYLAIYYPAAVYFFVSHQNDALYNAIESGLEAMIADGSFDQLFFEWHREAIVQATLDQRTIIPLVNPLLPEQTPLERSELWFNPDR